MARSHAGSPVTTDEPSETVAVFGPEGNEVRPTLAEYLGAMWERRSFAMALADAELGAQRSGTVLGRLWPVIDAVFQAALYWLLFSVLRQQSDTSMLTIIVGSLFLFSITSSALSEGPRSIRSSRHLILNSTFPLAILPATSLIKALLRFRLMVPVYVALHLVVGASVGTGIAVLPLLLDIQLAATAGLVLLLAVVTTRVRDFDSVLNYLVRIVMFTTPVIYPATLFPDDLRPVIAAVNPFFALFTAYQAIILGQVPEVGDVVIAAVWATILLVVGTRMFRRHEHTFAAAV
jgi:teichoic acid transport system permease protein